MQVTNKRKRIIHNSFLLGMCLESLLILGFGLLGIVYGHGETFVKSFVLTVISTLWLCLFFFANSEDGGNKNE